VECNGNLQGGPKVRFIRIAFLFAVVANTWLGLQPACAQDITIPKGVVAKEIDPPAQAGKPRSPGTRVMVIEIFDYTCGHCGTFQPLLDEWAMQQPDDVDFVQLPSVMGSTNTTMQFIAARAYITLMIMGQNGYPKQSQVVHRKFFSEIQPFFEHFATSDPDGTIEDLIEFMAAQAAREGMDKDEFKRIYRSHEVDEAMITIRRAEESFDFEALPAIVINGAYVIYQKPFYAPESFDDFSKQMLKLAGQLVHNEP
jgi:thiol:disulfide interchange protein DsbA